MKSWLLSLGLRERWMLGVGSVVILTTLYFLFVFEPLKKSREIAINQHVAALSLNSYMNSSFSEIKQISQSQGNRRTHIEASALLGVIDKGLKQSGISQQLTSISPDDDSGIIARFNNVNFDLFITWLSNMYNDYQINIQSLQVSNTSIEGRVKVSVTIN